MQQKRFKYLICGVLAGLLLIAAAVAAYFRYASPTRVALVNYPEYVIAPMLDNRINPAIEVEVMDWHESSGEELRGFDCVIFFGMGLHFTEEQMEWLRLIKDHIASSLSILPEDLDLTPFDRKGGLLAFYDAFGNQYEEILREMNIKLVA